MSTYSDLPSSRPIQRGSGFFSSLGKVFKKIPIASTAASFIPGPAGKVASSLLASRGLGQRRRRRVRRKPIQQGGRINFKKLAQAALPYVKQSGVVNKLAGKAPIGGPLLKALAKSQGFGKRRRRKRPQKVQRRRRLL